MDQRPRRDSGPAALPRAPQAWRRWVADGDRILLKIQRRVAAFTARRRNTQLPTPGSVENKILTQVYDRFAANKHAFESLTSMIVGRILSGSGTGYLDGWITKASGDNGIDFVSRLDVGNGDTSVKLVVLGQAKCTIPTGPPISAGDLARVVARLRRGWLGAYVTTATYSEPAQHELITDECPILLVDSLTLAGEVRRLAAQAHGGSIDKLSTTSSHPVAVQARNEPVVRLHLHRRPPGRSGEGEDPCSDRTWQASMGTTLARINQILRGRVNYFRHAVCSHTPDRAGHFVN